MALVRLSPLMHGHAVREFVELQISSSEHLRHQDNRYDYAGDQSIHGFPSLASRKRFSFAYLSLRECTFFELHRHPRFHHRKVQQKDE